MAGSSDWPDIRYVIPDEGGEGDWVAVNPHFDYPDVCPIETSSAQTPAETTSSGTAGRLNKVVEIVGDEWAVEVQK